MGQKAWNIENHSPLSQTFKLILPYKYRKHAASLKIETILKFSVNNVTWTLICQFEKGWERSNWNNEADWDQSESMQEIWYASTNKIKKRWFHCKKYRICRIYFIVSAWSWGQTSQHCWPTWYLITTQLRKNKEVVGEINWCWTDYVCQFYLSFRSHWFYTKEPCSKG